MSGENFIPSTIMNAWIKNKTKVFIATTVLTFEGTIKYISNYEVVIIPDGQNKPIILFKGNIISIMKHDLYQKMSNTPKEGINAEEGKIDKPILVHDGELEKLSTVETGEDFDIVVPANDEDDEFGAPGSEEFGGHRSIHDEVVCELVEK